MRERRPRWKTDIVLLLVLSVADGSVPAVVRPRSIRVPRGRNSWEWNVECESRSTAARWTPPRRFDYSHAGTPPRAPNVCVFGFALRVACAPTFCMHASLKPTRSQERLYNEMCCKDSFKHRTVCKMHEGGRSRARSACSIKRIMGAPLGARVSLDAARRSPYAFLYTKTSNLHAGLRSTTGLPN